MLQPLCDQIEKLIDLAPQNRRVRVSPGINVCVGIYRSLGTVRMLQRPLCRIDALLVPELNCETFTEGMRRKAPQIDICGLSRLFCPIPDRLSCNVAALSVRRPQKAFTPTSQPEQMFGYCSVNVGLALFLRFLRYEADFDFVGIRSAEI